jgi:hypothetical protein
MDFDTTAGGHLFDPITDTCRRCKMSRKQFEDSGLRCAEPPPGDGEPQPVCPKDEPPKAG